jgi:hypothetical protein
MVAARWWLVQARRRRGCEPLWQPGDGVAGGFPSPPLSEPVTTAEAVITPTSSGSQRRGQGPATPRRTSPILRRLPAQENGPLQSRRRAGMPLRGRRVRRSLTAWC